MATRGATMSVAIAVCSVFMLLVTNSSMSTALGLCGIAVVAQARMSSNLSSTTLLSCDPTLSRCRGFTA